MSQYQDRLTPVRLLRATLAAAPPDAPVEPAVTNGALAEALAVVEAALVAAEDVAAVLRDFDIPNPAALRLTLRRVLPTESQMRRELTAARTERDIALRQLRAAQASRARPAERRPEPRSGHRHDFFVLTTYNPAEKPTEFTKFEVLCCHDCFSLACMPYRNYADAPGPFRDRFEADMRERGWRWSSA